jgi:hypothetical protein
MKNTAMVNGRLTAEQMEWLQARADEMGGNLSAALRQTIADARILEMARLDYERLLREHPEFTVPYNDDDGTSRVFDVALRIRGWKDEGDDELRKLEEHRPK